MILMGLSRLDEGDGLEETFSQRRARWYLSCYGKFNSTKVERARKQRASSDKHAAGGSIQGLVCPLHHHVRLLGWKIVRRLALFAMSLARVKRYCTKHPLLVLVLE